MKTVVFWSIFALVGMIVGCSKKSNESKQRTDTTAVPNAVAGIHWTVPSGWSAQPKRQMRAATYTAPAPKEGIDAGECGVFYFGKGQGGSVEDNLNRWVMQFEKGGKHEFGSKDVNGLKVSTVKVTGTYLAPSGPMMESQGKMPDYRLLGAIVETPQGAVFFKFTGPAQTVDANEAAFDQMVNSVAKDQ